MLYLEILRVFQALHGDQADSEAPVIDMENQLLYISLAFLLGYGIGTLDNIVSMLRKSSINSINNPTDVKTSSFVSSIAKEQKNVIRRKVEIDDSKYVTDVPTDGLKSGTQPLGIVSQTNDDISSATNKLAQLKKLKG